MAPVSAEFDEGGKLRPPGRRWRRLFFVLGALVSFSAMAFAALAVWLSAGAPGAIPSLAYVINGQQISRYGRVSLTGVTEIPGGARLKEIVLSDARGPWLEVENLELHWQPKLLLARTLSISRLNSHKIQILRSPLLAPARPQQRPALDIDIAEFSTNLRVSQGTISGVPAINQTTNGRLLLNRDTTFDIALKSAALQGSPDRFDGVFSRHKDSALVANLVAQGGQGGAINALLGVPGAASTRLEMRVHGDVRSGRATGSLVSNDLSLGVLRADWDPIKAKLQAEIAPDPKSWLGNNLRRLGGRVAISVNGDNLKDGKRIVAVVAATPAFKVHLNGPVEIARSRILRGSVLRIERGDLGLLFDQKIAGLVSGTLDVENTGFDLGDTRLGGTIVATSVQGYGVSFESLNVPVQFVADLNTSRLTGRAESRMFAPTNPRLAPLGTSPTLIFDVHHDRRRGDWRLNKANLSGKGITAQFTGRLGAKDRALSGKANLADVSALIESMTGRAEVGLNFVQTDATPWRGRATLRGENLSSDNQFLKQVIGSRVEAEIMATTRVGVPQFDWRLKTGAARAHGIWQTGVKVPFRGLWTLDHPFEMQGVSVSGLRRDGPNGDIAFGPAGLAVGSRGARIAINGWTLSNAQILGVGGAGGKPFAVSLRGLAPLGPVTIDGLITQSGGVLDVTSINARHAGLQVHGKARGVGSQFDGLFDLKLEPGAVLTRGSSAGKLGFALRNGKIGLSLKMDMSNAQFKGAPFYLPAGRLSAAGLLDDLALQFSGDVRAGSRAGRMNLLGKANLSGRDTSLVLTGGGAFDGKAIVLNEPLRAAPLGTNARLTGGVLWDANRIRFDSKIRDGGLDVKLFTIEGANLTARIAGRLGGDAYRLQGEARIADFSAFNEGLKGRALGTMIVSGSPSQGWTARLIGQGENFSFGTSDFDPLLGNRPRFELEAKGEPERPIIGSWKVLGRQLSGEGVVSSPAGGQIPDLNGAWRIQGPLSLGGSEIVGQLNGHVSLSSGALSVTAASNSIKVAGQNWTDIDARADIAEILAPTNVLFEVAATGSLGPIRLRGHVVTQPYVSLQPLTFNYAGVAGEGDLLFGEAGPTGLIHLQASPDQLLTSGKVTGSVRLMQASLGTQVDARLQLADVDLAEAGVNNLSGNIIAVGALKDLTCTLNLDFSLRGQPVEAGLNGRFVQSDQLSQLTLGGGGLYQGSAWRLQEPLVVSSQNQSTWASGRAIWRGADLGLRGKIERGSLNATAILKDAPASIFGSPATGLDGRLNGSLTLTGRGQDLTGEALLQATGLKPKTASAREATDGAITATLRNGIIALRGTASNSGGLRVQGDARLPMDVSQEPFRLQLNQTRSLEGAFDVSGPVESIVRLGLSANSSASGSISARGQLAGTFAAPSLRGRAELVDAALRDPNLGVRLTQANAAINFSGANANIESLTASDGRGGKLSLKGQVNLAQGNNWHLKGTAEHFQLIDSSQALVVATGNWSLASTNGQATLGGDLALDNARIEIPSGAISAEALSVREINRPTRLGPVRAKLSNETATKGSPAPASAKPLLLDLRLKSGGNTRIIGRGFDGAFDLALDVKGDLQRPMVSGRADLVRGRFDLAGRSFDLTTGRVTFINPLESSRIEFVAERETSEILVAAKIQGTLGKPLFKLESTPTLPQDEILSRIFFGRNVAALSLTETAQLAFGLTSLTTGTQLDPTARIAQALALERLSLGTEGGVFSGLTAGVKLAANVYVEVVTGGKDGTVTMLEWRPRRRVQVQVKTSQDRQSSVSVRVKSKD
jgi:translocation and assembly module TamB